MSWINRLTVSFAGAWPVMGIKGAGVAKRVGHCAGSHLKAGCLWGILRANRLSYVLSPCLSISKLDLDT